MGNIKMYYYYFDENSFNFIDTLKECWELARGSQVHTLRTTACGKVIYIYSFVAGNS
jgi:hypothetical protein